MISASQEGIQSGQGSGFFDSVSVDFNLGERGTFGFVRIVRLPSAGRATASAVLFVDRRLVLKHVVELDVEIGSWESVELDGIEVETLAPLERWRLALSAADATVQLDVRAVSPPLHLTCAPSGQQPAEIEQYEQVCELSGELRSGAVSEPISCSGRRGHAWGLAEDRFQRWRSVYALSSEGRAVTVAGAGPAGREGHDDELLVGAQVLNGEAEPLAFEQVRLSTVYGADGLPVKAGLELLAPGEEIPRRLGAEAVCGTKLALAGREQAVTFMRWSLDREPAFGSYETVRRA
jgi:hypothetical protein